MTGGGTRPRLHVTADGWVNDPLGPIYRDGLYHLFFQYVPGRREWAPGCHWGHVTSEDLVHWTAAPVALAPGEGDDGCWSGSVVQPAGGEPVMFYTAVDERDVAIGRVRTARPLDPGLARWRKDAGTVVELPDGVPAAHFRDPFVFAAEGRWWMVVGAGLADGTATALAWVSDDLAGWSYRGPVAARSRDERAGVWTGSLWECPQIVAVGDRHVLVVSVWDADVLHHVAGAVGRFTDGRFEVDGWHRLTWGPSPYAASSFRDREDRPGLVFWLRGVADPEGGWTGAISVPYLLGLDGDRPVLRPHDAVTAGAGGAAPSTALEVRWRPAPGAPELRLVDEEGADVVVLRQEGAAVDVRAGDVAVSVPHDGDELRVLLDGPVLEIAGGSGLAALPVRGGARGVRPRPAGPGATVSWRALDVVR